MRILSRIWYSFTHIERTLLFLCSMALLFFSGSAWARYRVIESLPPIFEDVPVAEAVADARKNALGKPSILVHVAGEVKQSGVVTLSAASRVSDAIKAAGGARPGADLEALNLAQKLQDGEKVFVPQQGAAQESEGAGAAVEESTSSARGSSAKKAPLRPININKASAAELETLPGVGPVLAERIIAERTEKPFSGISDLGRVSGLGTKKLEKIKPYATF